MTLRLDPVDDCFVFIGVLEKCPERLQVSPRVRVERSDATRSRGGVSGIGRRAHYRLKSVRSKQKCWIYFCFRPLEEWGKIALGIFLHDLRLTLKNALSGVTVVQYYSLLSRDWDLKR